MRVIIIVATDCRNRHKNSRNAVPIKDFFNTNNSAKDVVKGLHVEGMIIVFMYLVNFQHEMNSILAIRFIIYDCELQMYVL